MTHFSGFLVHLPLYVFRRVGSFQFSSVVCILSRPRELNLHVPEHFIIGIFPVVCDGSPSTDELSYYLARATISSDQHSAS